MASAERLKPVPVNAVIRFCVVTLVALTVLAFVKIVLDIAGAGISQLDIAYLTESPRNSGREGGVFPILVSTFCVLGVAIAVAFPISLAASIFVTEYLPQTSRWVTVFRSCMLILACVPSIAFGLFGHMFFSQTLGLGTSLLTGGLTLAVMIIPICTFAFEGIFRLLPTSYRYAAYSLGAARARFILCVLIPTNFAEIVGVILLGLGRALAETAALLFTSGYSDRMPQSLLDPGRVLSIHIYDLSMNIPGGDPMASASALLLIAIFLTISTIGLFITNRLTVQQR